MRSTQFKLCVSPLALVVALPAFAQSTDDATSATAEEDTLNQIVVTASSGNRAAIDSAVSVTSIDADIIENFKPQSESEIYRLIPGIQTAGTAGPGGNSNIAVRGLPVATGGSPFVQL